MVAYVHSVTRDGVTRWYWTPDHKDFIDERGPGFRTLADLFRELHAIGITHYRRGGWHRPRPVPAHYKDQGAHRVLH